MMAESTLPNQIHSLCQIHSAKFIMQFGRSRWLCDGRIHSAKSNPLCQIHSAKSIMRFGGVDLAKDPKLKFESQSASVGVIVCFIKFDT